MRQGNKQQIRKRFVQDSHSARGASFDALHDSATTSRYLRARFGPAMGCELHPHRIKQRESEWTRCDPRLNNKQQTTIPANNNKQLPTTTTNSKQQTAHSKQQQQTKATPYSCAAHSAACASYGNRLLFAALSSVCRSHFTRNAGRVWPDTAQSQNESKRL